MCGHRASYDGEFVALSSGGSVHSHSVAAVLSLVRLKSEFLLGFVWRGFDSVVTKVVKAVALGARPKLQVESPNFGCFTGFPGYSA